MLDARKGFRLKDLVLVLIMLTLGMVQLAFGGIFIWGYARMAAVMLGLAILFMLIRMVRLFLYKEPLHLPPAVFLVPFLLMAFGFVQLAPLPQWLVGILSPERTRQFAELVRIGAVDPDSWLTLSVSPHATWLWLAKLASYLAAFFVFLYCLRGRRRVMAAVLVLVAFALFQIFYGSVQAYSHTPRIWWWVKDLHESFVSGTYFNRNHLAGFLEMVLPLWLGFTFWVIHLHSERRLPRKVVEATEGRIKKQRVRATAPRPYAWHRESWRQKVIAYASRLERWARPAACYTVAAVLFVGLLLTGSRGGIIAFFLSLCIMGVHLLFFKKYSVATKALAVVVAIGLVLGLSIGLEQTLMRFESEEGLHHRIEISRSVLPLVGEYAATGAGLGNFKETYLAHSLPRYGGRFELIYAHNDWLQIAAEAGVPGLVLAAGGFILLLAWSFRIWRTRHDVFITSIGLGLITGLISIALHSFSDFNMQIPANALTLTIVTALLAAVLTMRHTKHGIVIDFWEQGLTVNNKAVAATLLGIGLVTAGLLLDKTMSHAIAENICATERNPMKRTVEPCGFESVFAALDINPSDPSVWAKLGAIYQSQNAQSRVLRSLHARKAAEVYTNALARDPVNGRYWLYLGESHLKNFIVQGDFQDMAEAEQAFVQALRLRPNDARLLSRLAEHRLWLATLMPEGPMRAKLRQDGIVFARRSLESWRWDWREVVPMVVRYTQDPEELKHIVPKHEVPGRKVVSYLEKMDISFPPGTFSWDIESEER
ncbi:MAG: O-antigen ligase family protein [Oceanidesulfovibrio sp.]